MGKCAASEQTPNRDCSLLAIESVPDVGKLTERGGGGATIVGRIHYSPARRARVKTSSAVVSAMTSACQVQSTLTGALAEIGTALRLQEDGSVFPIESLWVIIQTSRAGSLCFPEMANALKMRTYLMRHIHSVFRPMPTDRHILQAGATMAQLLTIKAASVHILESTIDWWKVCRNPVVEFAVAPRYVLLAMLCLAIDFIGDETGQASIGDLTESIKTGLLARLTYFERQTVNSIQWKLVRFM